MSRAKYQFYSKEHEVIRMMQTALVASLFTSSIKEQLALKGGLAMQAVMGSERATADMDLDAAKEMPLDRLQRVMRKAIETELSPMLEDAHVSEPKQTDTVCRWKIWGRIPGSDAEAHFQVEVSRRDAIATPADAAWVDWKSEGVPVEGVKVKAHKAEMMTFMKLLAVTSPARDAPRDLHDLNVLIEAGYKPSSECMAKLSDQELQGLADQAWGKIDLMSFERFEEEVIPFLDPALALKVNETSYDEMRIRVGSAIEGWAGEEINKRLAQRREQAREQERPRTIASAERAP